MFVSQIIIIPEEKSKHTFSNNKLQIHNFIYVSHNIFFDWLLYHSFYNDFVTLNIVL